MSISIQPLQLFMGALFILVPGIFLFIILRRKSKVLIAIIIVSVAFLTALAGFAVFNKIYPEVERGDDIYDTEGSIIKGYYCSRDVYDKENNKGGEAHRNKMDENFDLYHSEYMENFEYYKDKIHSKYANGLIGLGIGGGIIGITLIFVLVNSGKSKDVEREMDIYDIFS